MTRLLALLFPLFALFIAGPSVAADAWPSRPIKMTVPFPPGGSADPIARLITTRLGPVLGQPFIVENRAGASGVIGTDYVAKSPPDGHTWVLVFDTHAVNPSLIPKMPFDSEKDLAPVMLIGTAALAIASLPSKPYKSMADVVAAARSTPGAITFGSVQNGSTGHLEMLLWQEAAGVKLTHVPYRGAGPMITDALGGHIELAIGSAAVIGPQVRDGKLRGLAITSAKRQSTMPDVPTLAELGYPKLDAYAWWGIYAPAGVPMEILARFHAEVAKVLRDPEVAAQLRDTLGMSLVVSTPEELRSFAAGEARRWATVIKMHAIKND